MVAKNDVVVEDDNVVSWHLEGQCPYCHSEEVEYGAIVIDETQAYFPLFMKIS